MEKTKITITIEQDGKTAAETTAGEETPENREQRSRIFRNREMTEAEADRYAVASDLANVCEYLEDSEVIKNTADRKQGAGTERKGRKRWIKQLLKIIAGIIAGILLLLFWSAAAVGAVCDYMKERDREHKNLIDSEK